tara:strand:+ start:1476 stop:1724 length:249 start_codon:yes stop_codon:yes gene_type:complete
MSPTTHEQADRPTVKAWVSKPGKAVDVQSLEDLQKTFGNRLNVSNGQYGETIIACQPQDKDRLDTIMCTGDMFTEQTIYADL